MTVVSTLNDRFAIQGQLEFREDPEGFVVAEISNRYATAKIALQGAQVISWVPANHKPVIWISNAARYQAGKSLRGGIPVCWPWFGPNETQPALPAHGYARTLNWEVQASRELDDGSIQLVFSLTDSPATRSLWPYHTHLEYRVTVGEILQLELETKNTETTTISITEALHTYFYVGDIANVSVHGLEDTEYLDKVDGGLRKIQQGPVKIGSEVDRIYLGTRADCIIEDPVLVRKIRISKQGSESTVVWNPWSKKADKLGDLGEEGYRQMLCVESANAAEDELVIAPGETHLMRVSYQVERMT